MTDPWLKTRETLGKFLHVFEILYENLVEICKNMYNLARIFKNISKNCLKRIFSQNKSKNFLKSKKTLK